MSFGEEMNEKVYVFIIMLIILSASMCECFGNNDNGNDDNGSDDNGSDDNGNDDNGNGDNGSDKEPNKRELRQKDITINRMEYDICYTDWDDKYWADISLQLYFYYLPSYTARILVTIQVLAEYEVELYREWKKIIEIETNFTGWQFINESRALELYEENLIPDRFRIRILFQNESIDYKVYEYLQPKTPLCNYCGGTGKIKYKYNSPYQEYDFVEDEESGNLLFVFTAIIKNLEDMPGNFTLFVETWDPNEDYYSGENWRIIKGINYGEKSITVEIEVPDYWELAYNYGWYVIPPTYVCPACNGTGKI